MIKVEGLTKRYARNVAVDNISFEVRKRADRRFSGPQRRGKDHDHARADLLHAAHLWDGHRSPASTCSRIPMEVKRRIGYLPETPPLYPDMEVVEYLDFVGRIKGIPSADLAKRIDEVMEKCAIADVQKKLIGKLSKGYRQRVGLAQAILHNPDVLILDEPTSGLDPHQIIETRDLIKGLAGDHTIILSTHILPEVEQICEKVIIIAKGKLVATDTVENLTSRLRGSETVAVEVLASGPRRESSRAWNRWPA